MFMDVWGIADRSDVCPPDLLMTATPPPTAADIAARGMEQLSWDKWSRQGVSLLVLVVCPKIFQSINLTHTLRANWTALSGQYGRRTGLNAWVDFRTYITTTMDDSSPIFQQIDSLLELHSKIVEGGLAVSEQLHALVTLLSG